MKNLVFILTLTIACGFVGMLIAPYFIPQGAGLAGGAKVLSYGFGGLLSGLLLALFLKDRLSPPALKSITYFAVFFNLIFSVWIFYRAKTNATETNKPFQKKPKTEIPKGE